MDKAKKFTVTSIIVGGRRRLCYTYPDTSEMVKILKCNLYNFRLKNSMSKLMNYLVEGTSNQLLSNKKHGIMR